MEQEQWLLRVGRPRGRQCSALREAEGAQAGGCVRHTIAPDHWRAQECRSQRPGEPHQGRTGHPQRARDCGTSQGGLSRAEYLRFAEAERS